MEFRLTYAGPLLSSGNSGHVENKHAIRRAFHPQIRAFWEAHNYHSDFTGPSGTGTWADYFATKHAKFGYRFVPLAVKERLLCCELRILFLRFGPPGAVIKSGDIDGRLKTLFDALSIPSQPSQIPTAHRAPGPSEDPFYCVVEDDSLISAVTVETDLLLEPVPGCEPANATRIVVLAKVRPYRVTSDNIDFV